MFKLTWLLVAIATRDALGDSHADICATQFNWWANVADNLGPSGYPIMSAKNKLLSLARAADKKYSVCDMQTNANAYYYDLNDKAVTNGQLGFPFTHDYSGTNTKQQQGFSPDCKIGPNSTIDKGEIDYDGPTASCAFGYPGQKDDPLRSNLNGLCRLKIFGKKDSKELQWCISNILDTMTIGVEGGYTNKDGPALKCPDSPVLGEQGSTAFPPISSAAYPSSEDCAGVCNRDQCGKEHKSSPYESFAIIFRKLADTTIEGLCDHCEECQKMASQMPSYRKYCPQFCKKYSGAKPVMEKCKKACKKVTRKHMPPQEVCNKVELCSNESENDNDLNSQPRDYHKRACNEVIFPSKKSTIPNTPSVWQKTNCFELKESEAVYDLALVGAGIGGAYVANQLRNTSEKHTNTIAMFEASDNVGGRLLSAFQAGALGSPVRPFNNETNVVPGEYGGMRISPAYPLVFEQVRLLWEKYFRNEELYPNAICTPSFCRQPENMKHCCEGLLIPMNVGFVKYHSTREELGKFLMSATLKDPDPLYNSSGAFYNLDDIKNHKIYSPYVQCALLAVGVNHLINEAGVGNADNAVEGFKKACTEPLCSKVFQDGSKKFCEMCAQFKGAANAAVSCSGYDTGPDHQRTGDVIGLMDEVVNVNGTTTLYLFTVGYQRLAQELLQGTKPHVTNRNKYSTVDIAPHFRKKLVAIGVGPGKFKHAVKRARELAKDQVGLLTGRKEMARKGPYGPIRLKFDDGSLTTSSLAYLSMLPYDAVDKIDGLEPWRDSVHDVLSPVSISKGIIAWENFSLAKKLGFKPCVQILKETAGRGTCDRIILDGNHHGENAQVIRQAWLWDYKQIMFYQVGGAEEPATTGINLATKYGTEAFVESAIKDLQAAVDEYGIKIPPPEWVRLKQWPKGSICLNWANSKKEGKAFSNIFRRPFGNMTDIWYGNSEMAADGSLHGWAEGALDMAVVNLPEMMEQLKSLKN